MDGEAEEPTLLQTMRGHGAEVTCCDVAGHGGAMASGGGDRAVRLWTWRAGEGWVEADAAPQAHRYGVTCLRWARSGALLASGGVDGTVAVWGGAAQWARPARLSRRAELAAPAAAAVRALCWPGEGLLAAGHDDGAVALWHVPRRALAWRLAAHDGAVHALAAPRRGALLLTACTEGVLKVFDTRGMAQGEPTRPSPVSWHDAAHDMGVLCADASECGAWAATGGHDARVRLWRAEGGHGAFEALAALEGHGAGVTAVRWAGLGAAARLLSASLDRTARLWLCSGACVLLVPAHSRYLTCVALARDLSFMITGSNDKSLKMWSLCSLTIDDEISPTCSPFDHFAVGDLEGISAVDDDELLRADAEGERGDQEEGEGAVCEWREEVGAAVNALDARGDLLCAAASDGHVRVWQRDGATMRALHVLDGHEYPALDVHFAADGALLLSAGLDGAARLWDVQSGVQLRALRPPSGGVRACRVSPHRSPLLLLATDEGVAPVWSLLDPDPAPMHVYSGHASAASCCAWSGCGRVLCVGGAEGELRVHRAPIASSPLLLHHEADAHDLGVTSCDFAGPSACQCAGAGSRLLLATAGADELFKIWLLDYDEDEATLDMQLLLFVRAAGGGVASVRWVEGKGGVGEQGEGALLVSAGGERWARVWRVRLEGEAATARGVGKAPVAGAAGAAAALMLESGELAVGALGGEVALWRMTTDVEEDDEDAGLEARWWGHSGVARWLRDHITRVPGKAMNVHEEAALLRRAREEDICGAQLLDMPMKKLLCKLGCGSSAESSAVRSRLWDELRWLRRKPMTPEQERVLPHGLRCPVSHRAMSSPTRLADGLTYDRVALHEWFIAADGAVSLSSGRRLRVARLEPNRRARQQLQELCNGDGDCTTGTEEEEEEDEECSERKEEGREESIVVEADDEL